MEETDKEEEESEGVRRGGEVRQGRRVVGRGGGFRREGGVGEEGRGVRGGVTSGGKGVTKGEVRGGRESQKRRQGSRKGARF